MKALDVLTLIVALVGGLFVGLIGIFGFNPLPSSLGDSLLLPRILYVIVGGAAVYQGLLWRANHTLWCEMRESREQREIIQH